jgi:Mrp family chromosome partitioning ATPase/capsular polysaccharide biosynthesis protein
MNEPTDAISILAPLWRRKWLILAVGIVVAAGSYLYYKRARPVFEVTTQIYLGAGGEEQAAGEKGTSKGQGAVISNQATIINSIVVENVHLQLRKEHKTALIRGTKVHATAVEKSQFITVTASAHTAKGAALLANTTVQAYIRRQRATHQRVTERQLAISRRQLHRIEIGSAPKPAAKATGTKGKGKESEKAATPSTVSTTNVLQAANLNSKINQLEASLSQSGAEQIRPAKAGTAIMLSPKPRKNAIFGFVIGIVLAAIAAYALDRLDRRLRSVAAVESILQTQILAGLPKVRRPVVRAEGRLTPSRFLLEPLRRLHIALGFVAGAVNGRDKSAYPEPPPERPRVILVTSADAGDGKSTLVADLALIQRDAGMRVAVVEANFRRPVQARLLGLDGSHGLADVLAGALAVEDALQRVMPTGAPVGPAPAFSDAAVATAVESSSAGSLFLLAGAGAVANPPAMLANDAMRDLLRSLAEDFDSVLVDGPSPLETSDVMALLGVVDGIVIVARLGHTRELAARRLVQLLASASPAPLLGAVANSMSRKEARRYGYSAPSGRTWPARLLGR